MPPGPFLCVVDLSGTHPLPLNHAAVVSAPVLYNGPCPMFLPVLATNLGAQKHDADSRLARGRARSLVGTTGVLANLSSAKSSACRDQTPRKSKKSRPVGEVRLGAEGAIILLEDQDRSRWDRAMIAEGLALLDKAMRHRRPGPYQVQAASAALH